MNDGLDIALKILVAVGGLAGLSALFMVRAQKRKLIAESGKTDAEADSVFADAQFKRTAREISMIEPYERIQARMQRELIDVYAELDRLREWAELMAEALRGAGVTVPPMPAKRLPSDNPTDARQ